MTYLSMAKWIEGNFKASDFEDWEDFQDVSKISFQVDLDIYKDKLSQPYKDIEYELTERQKENIDNIMKKEDLTKKEQMLQTMNIVKKKFSVKAFTKTTGMNPSTARRELGQAVKRGELKRVKRGVYEELWDVQPVIKL